MDKLKMFNEYLIENYSKGNPEENTIKAYMSDMKKFFSYYENTFGEDVVIIQRSNVIEYKKYLVELGRKYTTINRNLASMSIYENFTIDRKIKKDDNKVVKKADFYTIERPFITSDMLPRKTIRKVKNKAENENKRDYCMFVLFDNGGLRVSELTKLELNRDIDLDSRRIILLGKGNKVRMIFIDDYMYSALNDYIEKRNLFLNGRENKYLFVSNKTANTGEAMGRTSINNILNKYCDDLKEKRINPHIFRHDCGTTMYEEGASDLMIKKALGHSSNATDIYTHQGRERLAK